VYSVVTTPLVADENNGYRVDAVVVSSEIVIPDVGLDQVGVPDPLDVNTWPVVPAEVNE